jgi:hypothetical protein
MQEFRPPVRPSFFRTAFGIVFPLVMLAPIGALFVLASGRAQPVYTIADGALTLESGDLFSGTRVVRILDVTDVRVATLRGGRRTAGTALPGFCAGRYSYPDLGAVWQLTDCSSHGVVVRAGAEPLPLVITPPDPDAFAAKVRAGEATVVTLPGASKGPIRALGLVLAPVAVIGMGMLMAVVFLGPGRMRYAVGGGRLEVRTLFGRNEWPLRGARASAYAPSRLWRVAGTGLPGYATGMFRESGQSTRVYATVLDHAVLIEGPGRVIVTPENREAFLGALRAEGATVD